MWYGAKNMIDSHSSQLNSFEEYTLTDLKVNLLLWMEYEQMIQALKLQGKDNLIVLSLRLQVRFERTCPLVMNGTQTPSSSRSRSLCCGRTAREDAASRDVSTWRISICSESLLPPLPGNDAVLLSMNCSLKKIVFRFSDSHRAGSENYISHDASVEEAPSPFEHMTRDPSHNNIHSCSVFRLMGLT